SHSGQLCLKKTQIHKLKDAHNQLKSKLLHIGLTDLIETKNKAKLTLGVSFAMICYALFTGQQQCI
ncbi:hypothetical protein, partial [Proteiniphilum sp. UBA5346]|uniref:hypothetical protein n=1 Tax=Proteiniphilum sp. UBA5346 TaxID=1947277 RepID=UPI0025794718